MKTILEIIVLFVGFVLILILLAAAKEARVSLEDDEYDEK